MTDYLLDRDRDEALERLRVLERLADPATRDHLERIGVGANWPKREGESDEMLHNRQFTICPKSTGRGQ